MTDENVIEAELPLDTAGARLMRAREAAGLSLKQLSDNTKIPERHLLAIEQGHYSTLPAKTYATGFARSYAKAVGANDAEIVTAVRAELANAEHEPPRRPVQTFEPGDPARLPSSALAWAAGLLAAVLVIAALVWWRSGSAASDELPPLVTDAAPAASTAPVAAAGVPAGGLVVFTALAPDLWVKFYDGNGVQLLQKQLALGESYTVPADNPQVLLWTARPEALAITVGGQPVAKLSDVQQMMKDVPVTAAALLARHAGVAPVATAAPLGATPAAMRPRRDAAMPRARSSAAPAPSVTAAPAGEPAPAPATAAPAPTPAAT